ncbi:hypothetical protein [Ilumatobacter sp.]|uniref:hypothetical protein n=1 Tax=Ilumatobacter sp. TaxID=1967498 RepID=UPI003AF7A8AA
MSCVDSDAVDWGHPISSAVSWSADHVAEAPDPPGRIARLDHGDSLADTELDAGRLLAGRQDVRAHDEEAGWQLDHVTGARQLETWFDESTEAGDWRRRRSADGEARLEAREIRMPSGVR